MDFAVPYVVASFLQEAARHTSAISESMEWATRQAMSFTEAIQQAATVFVNLARAISEVMSSESYDLIGKLLELIGRGGVAVWQPLIQLVGQASAVFTAFARAVGVAVAAIIGLTGAVLYSALKAFEALARVAQEVIVLIVSMVQLFFSLLRILITILEVIFQIIRRILQFIKEVLEALALLKGAVAVVMAILMAIVDIILMVISLFLVLLGILSDIFSLIINTITRAFGALTTVISTIAQTIGTLTAAFTAAIYALSQAIGQIGGAIGAAIRTAFQQIGVTFQAFGATMLAFWRAFGIEAARLQTAIIGAEYITKAWLGLYASSGRQAIQILQEMNVETRAAANAVRLLATTVPFMLHPERLRELARMARDWATAVGYPTAHVIEQMSVALQRGETSMLEHLGLFGVKAEVLETYAARVGKVADALTSLERAAAVFDFLRVRTAAAAGVYDVSVQSLGRLIQSFQRLQEAARQAIGMYTLGAWHRVGMVIKDMMDYIIHGGTGIRIFGEAMGRVVSRFAEALERMWARLKAFFETPGWQAVVESIERVLLTFLAMIELVFNFVIELLNMPQGQRAVIGLANLLAYLFAFTFALVVSTTILIVTAINTIATHYGNLGAFIVGLHQRIGNFIRIIYNVIVTTVVHSVEIMKLAWSHLGTRIIKVLQIIWILLKGYFKAMAELVKGVIEFIKALLSPASWFSPSPWAKMIYYAARAAWTIHRSWQEASSLFPEVSTERWKESWAEFKAAAQSHIKAIHDAWITEDPLTHQKVPVWKRAWEDLANFTRPFLRDMWEGLKQAGQTFAYTFSFTYAYLISYVESAIRRGRYGVSEIEDLFKRLKQVLVVGLPTRYLEDWKRAFDDLQEAFLTLGGAPSYEAIARSFEMYELAIRKEIANLHRLWWVAQRQLGPFTFIPRGEELSMEAFHRLARYLRGLAETMEAAADRIIRRGSQLTQALGEIAETVGRRMQPFFGWWAGAITRLAWLGNPFARLAAGTPALMELAIHIAAVRYTLVDMIHALTVAHNLLLRYGGLMAPSALRIASAAARAYTQAIDSARKALEELFKAYEQHYSGMERVASRYADLSRAFWTPTAAMGYGVMELTAAYERLVIATYRLNLAGRLPGYTLQDWIAAFTEQQQAINEFATRMVEVYRRNLEQLVHPYKEILDLMKEQVDLAKEAGVSHLFAVDAAMLMIPVIQTQISLLTTFRERVRHIPELYKEATQQIIRLKRELLGIAKVPVFAPAIPTEALSKLIGATVDLREAFKIMTEGVRGVQEIMQVPVLMPGLPQPFIPFTAAPPTTIHPHVAIPFYMRMYPWMFTDIFQPIRHLVDVAEQRRWSSDALIKSVVNEINALIPTLRGYEDIFRRIAAAGKMPFMLPPDVPMRAYNIFSQMDTLIQQWGGAMAQMPIIGRLLQRPIMMEPGWTDVIGFIGMTRRGLFSELGNITLEHLLSVLKGLPPSPLPTLNVTIYIDQQGRVRMVTEPDELMANVALSVFLQGLRQ